MISSLLLVALAATPTGTSFMTDGTSPEQRLKMQACPYADERYCWTKDVANFTLNALTDIRDHEISDITAANARITALEAAVSALNGGGSNTATTVTGFTPTSGAAGTTVTINGTGFSGASAVRFGGTSGTASTFNVVSANRIDATVPNGAVTGKIAVFTPLAPNGLLSSGDFTVTTGVPAAPTAVVADAVDSSTIDVSWNLPAGTLTGVIVQRFNDNNGVPAADYASSVTLGSTANNRTYTDMPANTRYWFRVAATNANGQGPWSAWATAQTMAASLTSISLQTVSVQAGQSAQVSYTSTPSGVTLNESNAVWSVSAPDASSAPAQSVVNYGTISTTGTYTAPTNAATGTNYAKVWACLASNTATCFSAAVNIQAPTTLYPPLIAVAAMAQPSIVEPSAVGSTQTLTFAPPDAAIYKTTITRVANAGHRYAKNQPWNSDMTKALLYDSSTAKSVCGETACFLNASDWSVIGAMKTLANAAGKDYPNESWTWSNTNPKYVYGIRNTTQKWIRVDATDATQNTVLKTFANTDFPGITTLGYTSYGGDEGNMDDNDTYAVILASENGDLAGGQPRYSPAALINAQTGAVICNPSGGNYAVGPTGHRIGDAQVSHDGKWFLIQYSGYGIEAYKTADCSFHRRITTMDVHWDACVDSAGAQVVVASVGESDSSALHDTAMFPLDVAQTTPAMTGTRVFRDGIGTWVPQHVSCRSKSRPGYATITVYNSDATTAAAHNVYHAVLNVPLDGSGKIERWAWDFQAAPAGSNSTNIVARHPGGVMSPDGKKMWFKTSWMVTDGAIHSYVITPGGGGDNIVPPAPTPLGSPALAFPGCQGAGCETRGGFDPSASPKIYRVNSLADTTGSCTVTAGNASTGTCTLRDCVQGTGPRACVFSVSGTISTSGLEVRNPYLTIDGATAPGGGIQVKGAGSYTSSNPHLISVSTNHVVVRGLKLRNTWDDTNAQAAGVEALSGSDSIHHIVWDHDSFAFGKDGNLDIAGYLSVAPHDITVSYSMLAKPVRKDPNNSASLSRNQLIGPNEGDVPTAIDLHHNLFAYGQDRNPLVQNYARLVNNVIFGYRNYGIVQECGSMDVVGNLAKKIGDGRTGFIGPMPGNGGPCTNPVRLYLADNQLSGGSVQSGWGIYPNGLETEATGVTSNQTTYGRSSPLPTSTTGPAITVEATSALDTSVIGAGGAGASYRLNCKGAKVSVRDTLDAGVITDYGSAGTIDWTKADSITGWGAPPTIADVSGSTCDSVTGVDNTACKCADTDADGIPDVYETYWKAQKSVGDITPLGTDIAPPWTNLEAYMSGLAAVP